MEVDTLIGSWKRYKGATEAQAKIGNDPRKHLIEGKVYRVENYDIQPFYTLIKLCLNDNGWYNLECFEEPTDEPPEDKEDDLEQELFEGMWVAYKAFITHFEDKGYDPSYFSLKLQGRILSDDFDHIMSEITFEPDVSNRKNE